MSSFNLNALVGWATAQTVSKIAVVLESVTRVSQYAALSLHTTTMLALTSGVEVTVVGIARVSEPTVLVARIYLAIVLLALLAGKVANDTFRNALGEVTALFFQAVMKTFHLFVGDR